MTAIKKWECIQCSGYTNLTRGKGKRGGWVTDCCGSHVYRRRIFSLIESNPKITVVK